MFKVKSLQFKITKTTIDIEHENETIKQLSLQMDNSKEALTITNNFHLLMKTIHKVL